MSGEQIAEAPATLANIGEKDYYAQQRERVKEEFASDGEDSVSDEEIRIPQQWRKENVVTSQNNGTQLDSESQNISHEQGEKAVGGLKRGIQNGRDILRKTRDLAIDEFGSSASETNEDGAEEGSIGQDSRVSELVSHYNSETSEWEMRHESSLEEIRERQRPSHTYSVDSGEMADLSNLRMYNTPSPDSEAQSTGEVKVESELGADPNAGNADEPGTGSGSHVQERPGMAGRRSTGNMSSLRTKPDSRSEQVVKAVNSSGIVTFEIPPKMHATLRNPTPLHGNGEVPRSAQPQYGLHFDPGASSAALLTGRTRPSPSVASQERLVVDPDFVPTETTQQALEVQVKLMLLPCILGLRDMTDRTLGRAEGQELARKARSALEVAEKAWVSSALLARCYFYCGLAYTALDADRTNANSGTAVMYFGRAEEVGDPSIEGEAKWAAQWLEYLNSGEKKLPMRYAASPKSLWQRVPEWLGNLVSPTKKRVASGVDDSPIAGLRDRLYGTTNSPGKDSSVMDLGSDISLDDIRSSPSAVLSSPKKSGTTPSRQNQSSPGEKSPDHGIQFSPTIRKTLSSPSNESSDNTNLDTGSSMSNDFKISFSPTVKAANLRANADSPTEVSQRSVSIKTHISNEQGERLGSDSPSNSLASSSVFDTLAGDTTNATNFNTGPLALKSRSESPHSPGSPLLPGAHQNRRHHSRKSSIALSITPRAKSWSSEEPSSTRRKSLAERFGLGLDKLKILTPSSPEDMAERGESPSYKKTTFGLLQEGRRRTIHVAKEKTWDELMEEGDSPTFSTTSQRMFPFRDGKGRVVEKPKRTITTWTREPLAEV